MSWPLADPGYWTRGRVWRLIAGGVILSWVVVVYVAQYAYTNWG